MMAVPTVGAPGVHFSESMDQEGTSSLDAQAENQASESLVDESSSNMPMMVLPPCQALSPQELEPVKAFVMSAVCYPENTRPPQGYRAIQDCLRKRDDPPMLLKVLVALRTAGSTLNNLTRDPKRHAQLVHLIFRMDPFEPPQSKVPSNSSNKNDLSLYKDYSLSTAHLHLVVALVSANSVFLTPALNAIWKLLTTTTIGGQERTARLHATLATLLRLVPMGNVFPVLASHFPFRNKPKEELEWYTRQCLRVAKYVPAVHGSVLELLIDKYLEMDVEIKIDDGGQVSMEEEIMTDEHDVFDLELSADQHDNKDVIEKKVDEMADKLDCLMHILFEHIYESAQDGTFRPSLIFAMLSPVFESSVLTTHRSKFVQFVIFYVCGLDVKGINTSASSPDGRLVVDGAAVTTSHHHDSEGLYRDFCSKLIEIVFDSYRATVTRQSAACYLASFVSRASYVCTETVCESLCALLRWSEAYLDSMAGMAIQQQQHTDAREQCDTHPLFYTICQAEFYIMCFRGSDAVQFYKSVVERDDSSNVMDTMTDDDGSVKVDPLCVDISPQRWERICRHNLDPLRYCLESVRGEFLHVSHVFHLLSPKLLDKLVVEDRSMTSLLRKKSKATLITTTATLDMKRRAQGVGGLGGGKNPLDSFFPFDPYLLRQSHGFIFPFYREWEGCIEEPDALNDVVPIQNDDSSDEESLDGDALSDDESVMESHNGTPESDDSTMGFQDMSLSPSRSLVRANEKAMNTPRVVSTHREVRTEVLKRQRQPSIEHGSW